MKRKHEKVEITNMCLIYKGNKILVQERNKQDWPGLTFPGGHVEKNENFYDAVIREVKEETGLKIKNPILCGIEEYKNEDCDRNIMLFYKCNEFTGTLKNSNEGKVLSVKQGEGIAQGIFMMYGLTEDDETTEVRNGGFGSTTK